MGARLAYKRQRMIPFSQRLIVALDVPSVHQARALVETLGDSCNFYKIGLQLLFTGGSEFARELADEGKRVFIDAKLLDISATVERAVVNIATLGASFLTVHSYPKAIKAAAKARGTNPLKILAVTVLTDMDDSDLKAIGYGQSAKEAVLMRAKIAMDSGADGVIASGEEAASIRAIAREGFLIVTPGIRRAADAAGGQKRIVTPAQAIKAGADHIVVGRPIVEAAGPAAEARAILAEIESALR